MYCGFFFFIICNMLTSSDCTLGLVCSFGMLLSQGLGMALLLHMSRRLIKKEKHPLCLRSAPHEPTCSTKTRFVFVPLYLPPCWSPYSERVHTGTCAHFCVCVYRCHSSPGMLMCSQIRCSVISSTLSVTPSQGHGYGHPGKVMLHPVA